MKSRVQFKFPTPKAWGSNSPPPGRLWWSNSLLPGTAKVWNARGMPGGGGMLKLRFERYIRSLFFARPLSLVPRSGLLRNRTETKETFGTMKVIDERRNHGIIPQGPRQYIFIALSPVLYRYKIKMAAIVSSKPLLLISSSLTRVS